MKSYEKVKSNLKFQFGMLTVISIICVSCLIWSYSTIHNKEYIDLSLTLTCIAMIFILITLKSIFDSLTELEDNIDIVDALKSRETNDNAYEYNLAWLEIMRIEALRKLVPPEEIEEKVEKLLNK